MKPLKTALAVLLLILISCSVSFATVPSVSSTSPGINASGVALNTTVQVTFNTPVDPNTMTTSSFYILDSAGNQVSTNYLNSTNNNQTWTITPFPNLSPCVTYTMIVTTTVKSNDTSDVLAAQFTRSFTTVTSSTAPTVVVPTVPSANATGVVESNAIKVKFDRMMDLSTITASTFGLNNGATGVVTFSTSGNVTTALFTPSTNLVSSTLYTATVGTGVKSACSVALAAPYSWQFTTRDPGAPYVTSTVPSAGGVNISSTSPISINFSDPIQTLTTSNISVTDGVTPVAGTVTFDTVSKLTATFTPTGLLKFSTLYTVTVAGAKSLAGIPLAGSSYTFSFTIVAQEIIQYCNVPPFVSTNVVLPNVLLIMDNSNSMDEDFNGAAVGSYSPDSKSVAGKTALSNIVQTYADNMRIGLMTYNLPVANKWWISNSPYFASYDPKSYCPVPPAECFDYCSTGNTASKTFCHNACTIQNAVFDETYMDEVITARTIGDATRTKYCGLVYPKTLQMINPTDPANYVYYKQALPFYNGGEPGNWFCYAPGFDAMNELTNTSQATSFGYNCYNGKTNTNDDFNNYTGNIYNGGFQPSDSDLAVGYGNFGKRNVSIEIGQTWFANSSQGNGFLQIPATSNDSVNTQKNLLLSKLTAYSGNQAGYMSCNDTGNPNNCSYIVNAGLTPTAGTLQSATDYFAGTTSPILQRCQKNFIIYVTDGLPSVDSSGNAGTATALIGNDVSPSSGTVLNKLDALHSISKTLSGTAYKFNVNTYVLGLGLTSDDKAKLGLMAEHGGTNQSYYADNTTQLSAALDKIFSAIKAQIASGTSASILSNSEGSGASLLQAIYYPDKIFKNSTEVTWIGELHNLWYYIDPYLQHNSVREDTDSNKMLNLSLDKVANFNFDGIQTTINLLTDTNGDGKTLVSSGTVGLDDVKSIWRAGKQLQARLASTRTIHTSIDGSTLLLPGNTGGGFNAAVTGASSTATALQPYLNTANNDALAETNKVINFIRGTDQSNYRNRKVSLLSADTQDDWKEWKLGDIISSTPQLQSNMNLNAYHTLYGDVSYKRYIYSSNYSNRGMVYVGANDGMLHAFKLGKLATSTGVNKATLTGGTDLGEEQWAYIPRNALPYLKYLADIDYGHLYYADGPTVIADVSINKPSVCSTDYADCLKDTTNGTNWSTVLIGSMGLGGASSIKGGSCVTGNLGTCVQTPAFDPADSTNSTGLGYSSYFAFDIANQYFNDGASSTDNSTLNAQPVFKWEFSPPGLGYATSGASIVRVSGVNADGTTRVNKNGKWFAVFASGPTGSINTVTHNFTGKSNQNLKIFVVDLGATAPLVLNTSYWVLDSTITNAFGGSITNANTDGDKSNSSSTGYYQDDVLYVGYTRANSATITNTTQWDTGGVLRILTKEDPNPANWTVSKVIDGIGPVTGAIDTLQDKNKTKFWLYFGTGRFYYVGDDSSSQRYLFGVQDRCYTTNNVFDKNCDATAAPGASPIATGQGGTLSLTDITNQSTTVSSTVAKGWYISLRAEDTANLNGAERVTTRASAQKSGAVFYTTLQPTSDVCNYGGTTHLWSVNYVNGDIPSCSALGGTTLIQMTTGAFEQVKFSDIFTCKNPDGSTHTPPTPPAPGAGDPVHITGDGGTGPGFVSGNKDFRSTGGLQGGTGGDGMPPQILRPTPRKEILHIKEK